MTTDRGLRDQTLVGAEQQIADAERLIQNQQGLVQHMRSTGRDTTEAEALLGVMKTVREQLYLQLQIIQRNLSLLNKQH